MKIAEIIYTGHEGTLKLKGKTYLILIKLLFWNVFSLNETKITVYVLSIYLAA